MNTQATIFGFLLFFWAAVTLHADRVARILYYGAPVDAPRHAFLYQADQEPLEVPLPRSNFSKSFDLLAGDIHLSFLPSVLPKDTPIPEAAPSLDIPKEWRKVLILVFSDPSNPIMPIRLKAIDASDDVFGPGELLFINFSEISIFGLVGKKKLLLHPEMAKVVSNPIPQKGEYQVKLDSVKDSVESRRWLMRQTWRHQPSIRRVVFVLPLPAPRTVKLYTASIRDF